MSGFEAEAAFKTRWLSLPASSSPMDLAIAGGEVADKLSFVFIAGYQAAQRLCFEELAADCWYSYAVSEDRRGIVPGVSMDAGLLNGTKTWIAAAAHVNIVLVTDGVQMGDAWPVPVDAAGVTLEVLPPGDFLGDLSVGRLRLDDHVPSPAMPLKFDFGLAEAVCTLGACAGHLQRQVGEGLMLDRALLDDVTVRLRELISPADEITALVELQDHVKALARSATDQLADSSAAADWHQNGRLFGMYGRSLKTRLER